MSRWQADTPVARARASSSGFMVAEETGKENAQGAREEGETGAHLYTHGQDTGEDDGDG